MNTTDLDQSVATLQAKKEEWARLPIPGKIALLEGMMARTAAVAAAMVQAAACAKRIPDGSPLRGEDWTSGPWTILHGISGYIRTLRALHEGRSPLKQQWIAQRRDGQVVVRVFPQRVYDWLFLNGCTAEVWMQPAVRPESLAETIGVFYQQKEPAGTVTLVLGAGNIASIAPLDVLYKMLVEGHVCILKMNPANDYQGPYLEKIFAEMVAAGYMRFAYGGKEVGQYLTRHPDIEQIHMTGGIDTHDEIVFGEGEMGAERKRVNQPITTKRVTSELGNASPTIVVPGPWTAADIRYQAENIATMVFHNQGFNCVSTQVIITPGDWSLTPLLLDAVREVIRQTPYRHAYYPGAAGRLERILAHHPGAELFDQPGDGIIPRAFITGLDPSRTADIAFCEEFFTTAFAQVSLPGKAPGDYLRNAIDFANQHLLGTLGISLLIHPATLQQPGVDLDTALAALRYGTIGVNTWTGLAYQLSEAPWGAFPGHTLNAAGSGIGVVHNTMMFDKPQKTVVRGPFRSFPRSLWHGEWHISPKPLWFLSNRQAEVIGRRVVYFEANPGPQHIPGIVWAALRG